MTHPFTSHVVELMLAKDIPVKWRRMIINHIIGSVASLATDAAGSHIIDACWEATGDIRHQRDKIAAELADEADVVRNNFFGKRVWRNWDMTAFVTNRMEWRRGQGPSGTLYAKSPVVKKKPWQQRQDPITSTPQTVKKKSYEGKPGIVTKHFSAVTN